MKLLSLAIIFASLIAVPRQSWSGGDDNHAVMAKMTEDLANKFIQNESAEVRQKTIDLLAKIQKSTVPLVRVISTEQRFPEPVILLVQGLTKTPGKEFYYPIAHFLNDPHNVYINKIKIRASLGYNIKRMNESLNKVLENHPGQKITIIGYSAGGVISTRLWNDISHLKKYQNVSLITAASPIAGYKAPVIFMPLVSPFTGRLTYQLGIGQKNKFKKRLPRCEHFVTTDCSKDLHACLDYAKKDYSPQILKQMPCGEENVTRTRESHAHLLHRIMQDRF